MKSANNDFLQTINYAQHTNYHTIKRTAACNLPTNYKLRIRNVTYLVPEWHLKCSYKIHLSQLQQFLFYDYYIIIESVDY